MPRRLSFERSLAVAPREWYKLMFCVAVFMRNVRVPAQCFSGGGPPESNAGVPGRLSASPTCHRNTQPLMTAPSKTSHTLRVDAADAPCHVVVSFEFASAAEGR